MVDVHTKPPIAWDAARRGIDLACCESAGLARALGAMGLYRRGVLWRGDVPGFAPAYQVFKPWRSRLLGSHTEAARGFAQGEWSEAATANWDRADAEARARVAEHNRLLRDHIVFTLRAAPLDAVKQERVAVLAAMAEWLAALRLRVTKETKRTSILPHVDAIPDPGGPLVFLDTDSFEWMDSTGAARGEDVASLAAWCWSCGVGRATARLARLLRVELWTVPELERRIADADAQFDAAQRVAQQEATAHVGA